MKKFLRENPTIAFGLGLPLLLVVVFLLVSGIPALLVDDPQYDLLYATNYYTYQHGVQVSVVDKKVQIVYQGSVLNNQKPRIWRYDAKTGAVREIAYLLPPGLTPQGNPANPEDASKISAIEAPDLAGLTVDSSNIAPDGYTFSVGSERYANHLFGELFYSSRYRYEAVLSKKGRSVRLPNADGTYYRGNTRFIGWVISP
ncbi:MAG: hypothetical protein C0624_10260 [Desulfuromonas sp.]|nr:MAG: hypothetical protein C0624_10260 [Desulfuromonas sp.]